MTDSTYPNYYRSRLTLGERITVRFVTIGLTLLTALIVIGAIGHADQHIGQSPTQVSAESR